MPRFPTQFTDAASVASTDYLMVNGNRATVADVAAAMGSQPSIAWNGTDVSQFGSANNVGAPVSPTLAFATQTASASDALRITVANGTGAQEGAIWWFTDTFAWQPMRIRMEVGVDLSNPIGIGETMGGGIVIGGDATQGSNVAILVMFDNPGAAQVLIGGNSAYNTSDFVPAGIPLTVDGAYYVIVDITVNARLTDAATYPPNGAPVFVMDVHACGITATTGAQTVATASSTDWAFAGTYDTDRIGVVGVTTTGVTATTGVLVSILEVSVA